MPDLIDRFWLTSCPRLQDKIMTAVRERSEKKLRVKYIIQNLESTYAIPQNTNAEDPLDELIETILSQSTSDVNSQRAFESLKKRFPEWESVRNARPKSIAAAIKSGGLANTKSIVIKNV